MCLILFTPTRQGVILRDSHGVAQVRFVTGNKILRVLKAKGLAPDLPEDLYHLIKKAVSIRKHLERSRKVSDPINFSHIAHFNSTRYELYTRLTRIFKDRDAKFRLILVESRIHRLARYYKKKAIYHFKESIV